ncbi:SDR family NAD(P)-dependent oxidoreductase [Paracoccus alkanivorans]|uniref:SDR family NAD(P)-dependent oxidoreductase n=1 Tax=Paracoccus alkanivorans TaxID=2116655 RepID=A0A3M0M2P6_9RHOB|nr:SDR family oxidoreductase [Paracoccus alkanivorans]RMC32039.1 SDR family NAD(P)-dependent oxidoreductase [Paracoccus alkanivorans]
MIPSLGAEGRVACVTGASSGLGKAVAQALSEGGAKIVSVSRRQPDWCDGASAVAVNADLSDLQAIPDIAAMVAEPFGPPDILVNAAGINTRQPADQVTLDGWLTTLDLNLSVPFFLAQALVPAMREKGWGRIVNFASLQSQRAFPGGIAYGASKGGIVQLTRAMAEAWSHDGIMVNALAPGFFPTELTGPVFSDPELSARNAAQTCIGRNGRMQDIIGPALFLCSAASDYVTGQTLYVDGGFTAK